MNAIDFILRIRRRMAAMQQELDQMGRRMLAREQDLPNELQALRKRLAQESVWKNR